MALMPDIAREAWHATHHHEQENPVTTSDCPDVFGDLAATLGRLSGRMLALGGNRLITRLAAAGLGASLADDDIEHVIAIVAAIECASDGRQPMPRRVPQEWAGRVPDAPAPQVTYVVPSADPSQPQVTA